MNVPLTPELERMVPDKAKFGRYNSARIRTWGTSDRT